MKYLKTFEKRRNKPRQFDYVVINDKQLDFVANNVGQIITNKSYTYDDGKDEMTYYVEYKNVPKKIQRYFQEEHGAMCLISMEDEIEFWSKNKKDAEAYLAMKKYNL